MGNKNVKSGPDLTEPELLLHGKNSEDEIQALIEAFSSRLKLNVESKFEDEKEMALES